MAQLNRKTLLIIISIFAVVLIIAAVIIWLMTGEEPAVNINTPEPVNVNTQVITVNTQNTAAPTANAVVPEDDDELALVRLANLFAERFGSYSAEVKFQNIIALKPYMTSTMQKWSDQYVADQNALVLDKASNSVVTKAVSTKVLSMTDDSAEVRVTTQRTEIDADTNKDMEPYYQEIVIKMSSTSDKWLVNSAIWQQAGEITKTETVSNDNANQANDDYLELLNNLANSAIQDLE